MARAVSLAQEVRVAYEQLSPLIENYTSEVCPGCVKVCCIDRHGTHEPVDLEFLILLGDDGAVPSEAPLAADTLPCRHLGARGCTLERWRRPYRCTWFFCAPLLEHMREGGSRRYRKVLKALERLGRLREQLIAGQAKNAR